MIEEIRRDLEELYKNKTHRLSHIYGVRDMALHLGKIHHLDLYKLEVAALLHDMTKYYTVEENKEIILDNYKDADHILNNYNKHIYHGFSAAALAAEKYHIKDKDILASIRNHTVGRANMSIYEEIIFIADYTEINRQYENCKLVRQMVDKNLYKAIYTAMDLSIKHFEAVKETVPLVAYEARSYYKKKKESNNE